MVTKLRQDDNNITSSSDWNNSAIDRKWTLHIRNKVAESKGQRSGDIVIQTRERTSGA